MTFFLGICLVVGTVSGILFNVYILSLSCMSASSQSRTVSQLLLFHLGLVNIFIAVVFLGGIAPNFFKEKWTSEVPCNIVGPVWKSLHIVVLWTITAINLDKYITISSPLHYNRFVTAKKASAVLILSWTISGGVTLPPLILSSLSSSNRKFNECSVDFLTTSKYIGITFTMVSNFIAFILPISLVTIVNAAILVIAHRHRHRIITALWDVTISAQATVTQHNSHLYLNRYRGRSAATTVLYHIVTLICVYLPSVICDIYEAITREKLPSGAHTTSFVFLVISPSVNGFVYGLRSKILKKRFMGLLRRQLYKSEVSCEIQERVPPSISGTRRPSLTPSIALPIQRQLTRRMSGILQPPCTTPTNNLSDSGGDSHPRLIRQSSELSWKFRKDLHSSEHCSDDKTSLNENQDTEAQHNRITCSPFSEPSLQTLTNVHNSYLSTLGICRQPSLEMVNSSILYNGGHRQSLRRSLFTKKKQKSLDLSNDQNATSPSESPPRSVSQQQIKEELSPSSMRPLLLPTQPLTPTRKNKKVSWSYDSMSTSEISTQDSPVESSETDNDSLCASSSSKGIKNRLRNKGNDLKNMNLNESVEKADSDFQRNLSSVLNRKRDLSQEVIPPYGMKNMRKLNSQSKSELHSPVQENISLNEVVNK